MAVWPGGRGRVGVKDGKRMGDVSIGKEGG